MLLKYKKISEFIEKMKEKPSVPRTPSPFAFSLVSSLPDVVKMKGNMMRGGDPSPSHPKRKETRGGGESLLVVFKTKGNVMRRGGPLLVIFKMKANTTRRGFLLPVVFKTKGNTMRRASLSLSRSKQKETRQGGGKSLLITFVIFVGSMWSRRGKWGGCAAGSSCWGVRY